MTINTQNQRSNILKSQILFGNFLNKEIIIKLITLFDEHNKSDKSIVKYIENERKYQGLNNLNIRIESKVYGTNDKNTTFILKIFKNNKQYLHFTIHLISTSLNLTNSGMIHFKKNVYQTKVSKKQQYKLYTLVLVQQPLSHSLHFSTSYRYNTPSNVQNVNLYNSDLKKEIKVIIDIFNKLFDETNKEFYIGNSQNNYLNIHPNTNNILNNINLHSKYTSRKNKGVPIFPSSNKPLIHLKYKNPKKTMKKIVSKK